VAQDEYDLVKAAKLRVNAPNDKYYEQARAASKAGSLELVDEFILEPYSGRGFELKKGQVVRYEMIAGPQILDTFYMVKSRPSDEWADSFHSASFGSHTFTEGIHYYSNSPWCRPLPGLRTGFVVVSRPTVTTTSWPLVGSLPPPASPEAVPA